VFSGSLFSSLQWWNEANSFHVVLTSYKLLFKDHSHFLRRSWRHLVLDEVQHIKNLTEKHWETIFSLKRWDKGALYC
jgi:E1A-binding protein p400